MELVDFRGLVIGKGDLVTYPGRRGSVMWLNIGHVEEVHVEACCLKIRTPEGRLTKVTCVERVAVLGRN